MDGTTTREQRSEYGRTILDTIDGEPGANVIDSLKDITPELGRQLTAWGRGEIYPQPGLEPRDRQLVTRGMLTALGGCEPPLDIHISAALNVGLTPRQIIESSLHFAVHCGFPRTLNATVIAKKVFAERGLRPLA